MRELKRKIALFLVAVLVLPSIITLLPMSQVNAEAASVQSMYWSIWNEGDIQVEVGENFYVGDYVYAFDGQESRYASTLKAKYKSSKKSVATVNSKGYMKALKTGKTKITVSYGGKKVSRNFVIVKKGTFSKLPGVSVVKNAAKTISNLPSKITKNNVYTYTKKMSDYNAKVNSVGDYVISKNGLLYNTETFQLTTKLAVPTAGRANILDSLLYKYSNKTNPLATAGSKGLKISKISGSASKNVINVTFNKKVTKDMIDSAKISMLSYTSGPDNSKLNKKKSYINVSIYQGDTYYNGFMLLTQGSKKATIQIYKYEFNEKLGKSVLTKQKFKKGKYYKIGYDKLFWGKGKKVKIK